MTLLSRLHSFQGFIHLLLLNIIEPASILELTSTVLELSRKLYKFFKRFLDAPEEIQEYLAALEAVRHVFLDIQEYVEMYQLSAFFKEDGMRLRVIEPTLKDCELEFKLQLSFVESMQPEKASSFIAKSRNQATWVLKKETIEGLTRKLEKLQSLLGLAIATSTGHVIQIYFFQRRTRRADTSPEKTISFCDRNWRPSVRKCIKSAGRTKLRPQNVRMFF